jgi:hypothetical protein
MLADGPQGGLHRLLGHGQPGAPAQVGGGGLVALGVGLLGQVADAEGRRRALDRPRGGRLQPGQAAQQGRLAGPVAAEHADAAGPVDDQVDVVEHDLGAADDGEVAGGEHAPAWHGRGRARSAIPRSGGGRAAGQAAGEAAAGAALADGRGLGWGVDRGALGEPAAGVASLSDQVRGHDGVTHGELLRWRCRLVGLPGSA